MKKWNEPKLVELNLDNTKEGTCSVDLKLKTPWGVFCDKYKSNGEKAYTPEGFSRVCKYHGGDNKFCNYPGQQS